MSAVRGGGPPFIITAAGYLLDLFLEGVRLTRGGLPRGGLPRGGLPRADLPTGGLPIGSVEFYSLRYEIMKSALNSLELVLLKLSSIIAISVDGESSTTSISVTDFWFPLP